MTQVRPLFNVAGRVFIAAIFVISGVGKISAYEGTQAFMASMGVPGALLPVVIAFEILAGLAVALGWQARIAAFLLAGFSLVTAVVWTGRQVQYEARTLSGIGIAGVTADYPRVFTVDLADGAGEPIAGTPVV